MVRLSSILVSVLLVAGIWGISSVEADHQRVIATNTPAIQNLLTDGDRAWCVNAALNNYPNAVTQLRQTYDSQFNTLGNTHHQIPGTFETPSAALAADCEVLWVGRYDNFCQGCSCNVFYGSWPVTVNVKLSLGYFDWKSCFGHEEGHIHGLGEFYIDTVSPSRCDNGYQAMIIRLGFATVMSCGTQVFELQPADVDLICQIYGVRGQRFAGCAPAPPPCSPCWNGTDWVFADGWRFRPNSGAGEWRDPAGILVWTTVDSSWNGRYSPVFRAWVQRGHDGSAFVDGYGWLSLAPP